MSWAWIILGGLYLVRAAWLMPSSDREASRPMAPYLALRAIADFGIGVMLVIVGISELPA